ncbi:MAG: phosphoribosylformylglycinamidine cyclo-ligase [Thermomicrobiales bacterium]
MTTYANAGVNLDAARELTGRLAGIVGGTRTPGVLADVGAFGGMFTLGSGGEPVLVASTDGVGTKVKIASGLSQYGTIGHDIVNHCINDIAVQGAKPLFFLDYLGLNTADPDIVSEIVGGVAGACREAGIALLGGETAEMPDVYAPGEFDLAGFVIGVADRGELGRTGRPAVGDALIGLPSSGLHTNGYSLARRALPADRWRETAPGLGMTIGQALLVPHRCYLSEIAALTNAGARGFAHITGGGFKDNIERVLPEDVSAVVDTVTWTPPVIFTLIQQAGSVSASEMYQVFNMGIGMTACVPELALEAALAAAPDAVVIGRVIDRGDGPPVSVIGNGISL